MVLKGLLRVAGVEYPKAHRVGRVLVESAVAQVVPAQRLRDVARIADELADAREDAFYGSEERPAAELFSREDAADAISKAKIVETFVADLVQLYIRP